MNNWPDFSKWSDLPEGTTIPKGTRYAIMEPGGEIFIATGSEDWTPPERAFIDYKYRTEIPLQSLPTRFGAIIQLDTGASYVLVDHHEYPVWINLTIKSYVIDSLMSSQEIKNQSWKLIFEGIEQ